MIDKFMQKEIEDLIDGYYESCKKDHRLLYEPCLNQLMKVMYEVGFGLSIADDKSSCGCYERSEKYIFEKKNDGHEITKVRITDKEFWENKGKNTSHTPHCNETFKRPIRFCGQPIRFCGTGSYRNNIV